MPRARKTTGGQPGQPVQAVTGQTYGDAKIQETLQKAMPAPNAIQPIASSLPVQQVEQPPSNPNAAQTAARPVDLMSILQGQGGILRAPDDRPSVPITDGLSTGPGRGPEALGISNSLQRTLSSLANRTGDPYFLELAAKAGR
jgi:hypothetical protein